MKPNYTFKLNDINRLRELIKQRIISSPENQKIIRDEMRSIGFYGFKDFGIMDLQPSHFEGLIKNGTIEIID